MYDDTPTPNKKAISYSPSFMSQIAMFPLKDPGNVRFMERTNGCVSVAVMQSMWGWTYGKIPRLFLIYVRSLVQTKSDKVDLENRIVKIDKSFHAFCEAAGLSTGTKLKDVEQSLLCLSGTTFTISLTGNSPDGKHFIEGRNLRLVSQFHLRFNNSTFEYPGFKDDGDPSSYIQFSEEMWSMFTDSPVPLNKRITFELGKSARALDIYQWLAYRAYGLRKPLFVPWQSLKAQFDMVSTPMRSFKPRFCQALNKVREAWPEVKVICGKNGVTVYPCNSSLDSEKIVHEAPVQIRQKKEKAGQKFKTNPFA